MKPSTRDDAELLAWVASIVRHEQERETHGEVRICLKAGKIQSVRVEQNHLPPRPGGR